ncbi:MAG TPA: hypothetical protein VNK04_19735 [Gemmataceae bacterium]|nr:hypothetical protein [Gemmataceae bacterium]
MLRNVLLFLIFLRLLWPPGICICHLLRPEAVPHHHDEDDHLPGCPASKMGMTLCSFKSEPPRLSPAPHLLLAVMDTGSQPTDPDVAPVAFYPVNLGPPDQPLYLTLRALLL